VGVRLNPGLGSGGTKKTNTGGPAASFGIWHEWLPQILAVASEHDLKIVRVHTHIGSGADPQVWKEVAEKTLRHLDQMPDVRAVDLGGGFKVARVHGEEETDLAQIGAEISAVLQGFADRTGRELHLILEPGTYLLANSAVLLATVADRVSTGDGGYTFLKLDAGMTEILRPSLYAAQHPFRLPLCREDSDTEDVVIVGHCCESGDLLTPSPEDSGALLPRSLPRCEIGELVEIGGSGAYCSAMSAANYNSFPLSSEVLLRAEGSVQLIRKRQSLDQILQNERPLGPT
jgi:diaminopimelate decarboxylase